MSSVKFVRDLSPSSARCSSRIIATADRQSVEKDFPKDPSRARREAGFFRFAKHVSRLEGESPLSNLMEVQDERNARASSRGGV